MSTPTRRSSPLKLRMMRAGAAALRIANGVGEVVAPGWTARAAARRWFQIPDPPAARHESGQSGPAGGSTFETSSLGHAIRGTSWGDGPVVYLVHGWAGSTEQMVGLVEPLLMRNCRVVVFDAPSHGRSDPGPSGPDGVMGSSSHTRSGRSPPSLVRRTVWSRTRSAPWRPCSPSGSARCRRSGWFSRSDDWSSKPARHVCRSAQPRQADSAADGSADP